MNDTNETIRLNLTSRAILAATVALGLGVAFFSAPTRSSRTTARNCLPSLRPDAQRRARHRAREAYGREDEDCVAVATGAPRQIAWPARTDAGAGSTADLQAGQMTT